ncbi:MAG: methyl-accepting chemotaxis sensory transducer [Gammaproteobacteria bacterium]|nr:methyl-accepting chemotaxis sensory transducer [Gammaproteobacteria bacterium]
MKWTVGTKISIGFGLTLAIFLVVGIVAYRSVTQQTEAADWVAHTRDVQNQLTQLLSNLQDAETGQRGYVITGVESYLAPYASGIARVEENRKSLARLVADNPRQETRADALAPLIAEKLAELQQTIDVRRARDFAAAQSIVLSDRGKKAMDAIRNLLQGMNSEEDDLLKKRADAAQADARNARSTIIFGTLAALVLAGLAGLMITRNIAGPLRNLTGVAERITVGDLSSAVAVDDRRDEVGMLARAFERMTRSLRTIAGAAEQIAAGDLRASVQPQSPNDVLGNAFVRMTDNLRRQIGGMVEGAAVLGSAASEIVAATAQFASGASESAAAVTETTTTVEEIRQTAQLASQKAKAVADTAQKALQISHNGRKSTEDVATGMNRIRKQMEAIAESIVRLSEQGQTIGQIIATVEDLAAQSNLLAVNAAIEAAKAGEHGKGFGVVAQEVKSLAEQSRQATDRVRTILGDIQKATTAAVMATEQGGKAVEAGGTQTEMAGVSIGALAGSVIEAAQAATQIAASSQQQLVGMDQVAGAMENIKQASTQNVASAKQLETAARNLNDLGQRLKHLAESYTV